MPRQMLPPRGGPVTMMTAAATIAGDSITVDGQPVALRPGCDAYTTLIRHVGATIARPSSTTVALTVVDEFGSALLLVDPKGKARVRTRTLDSRREYPHRRTAWIIVCGLLLLALWSLLGDPSLAVAT